MHPPIDTPEARRQFSADLRRDLGFQFQVDAGRSIAEITTPFRYPSGEPVTLTLSVSPDDPDLLKVSDQSGGAAELNNRLGAREGDEPLPADLAAAASQLCQYYETEFTEQIVSARAPGGRQTAAAIYRVIQCSLLVANLPD